MNEHLPIDKPAVDGLSEQDSIEAILKKLSPFGHMLQTAMNKYAHHWLARTTGGISPGSLGLAYLDWAMHLSMSPGKLIQLYDKAMRKSLRVMSCWMAQWGHDNEPVDNAHFQCIEALPHDNRFLSKEWQQWPFNYCYQSFLHGQQWWHNATTSVPGMTKSHEAIMEFSVRQWLDVFSPSNFILTNPEVLQACWEQGGQNLLRGAALFRDDLLRSWIGQKRTHENQYRVGEQLALTPGRVVARNHLAELIQYDASTDKVRPEPVLIVPAWIMKYYILDLSPDNSLIKYLTDQGFTVFCISWRNPDASDSYLGMDDYRRLGIDESVQAIQTITSSRRIHGVGYCLGGTLLSLAAANFAQKKAMPFASLSLLAAQVDFSEAGELMLFIDESQVTFLEDMMARQGYLDTTQMAAAFQMLRSNDLLWSRMLHEYLLGEKPQSNELMVWNADATRMPYKMHSEYLRKLFLGNELATGKYVIEDRPVAFRDVHVPVFAVGTETDHIAPWHSVYKINLIANAAVTFVLTSGGHNAGIISEPGHRGRHYRVATRQAEESYVDPEQWLKGVTEQPGSWWPVFTDWLESQSGALCSPPPQGARSLLSETLPAPGRYVFQQ